MMEYIVNGVVRAGSYIISFIRIPVWLRKFNFTQIEKDYFRSIDLSGCVILTKVNYQASNLFIEGYWDHAQMCVGGQEIVEATTHGIEKKSIIDGLKEKDDYIVLEPMFADEEDEKKASVLARTLVGKDYDYTFSTSNESYYCSEVIWYSYEGAMGENPFKPKTISSFGVERKVILPIDFYRANEKWNIIFRKPS